MMRRVFIDAGLSTNQELALDGDAFMHLCKVLRCREGDRVVLFNGQGGEYTAVLKAIEKKRAIAEVQEFIAVNRAPALDWQLLQAISKGDRMDYTLQKSTELGVRSVQPLFSERSVVALDEKRSLKKEQHWAGVVRSACEQCGMNRVPEISEIRRLDDGLSNVSADVRLMLDPDADDSILDVEITGSVALLVGPEGGLSESEIERARQAGFRGVRMGERVLRTETAAVVAAAVLLARHGDLG